MTLQQQANILIIQARFEFIKLIRMRVYTILLLILPLWLYSMSGGNPRVPDIEGIPGTIHLIASFGTFSTFGIALFGFGVGIATERGQRWTTTLRIAPISPLIPLIAKLFACMMFTALALIVLLVGAYILFGVQLPLAVIGWLLFTMILTSIPLCAMSLAIGSMVGPNSAPIILMMIYIVISSISGIVVPLEMIARGNPDVLMIAPIWPTFHAGQLALATVRPAYPGVIPLHIIALVAFTIAFLVIAQLANQFRLQRTFG